ncbi:MAG: Flp pilus assembly protein CpaB [Dehalococcoidia bacterium]
MAQARSFSLGGSSRGGLLLAAILAAITGVLVFVLLQGNDDGDTVRNSNTGVETTVVTASRNIDAREEITEDMLQLTKVPANALLGGVFSDRDLVVGRIARQPIFQGEQLVQDKLASEKRDLGLSFVVPEGLRGIGVEVDKVIGAGGLLRPGDRVDIVGVIDVKHMDLTTEREFTETRAFTLAQNIEVLAVEESLLNTVREGSTQDEASTDQPDADPEAQVVTLAMDPAGAQNLLLSDEKGAIRLIVRAPGDDAILDLPNTTFIDLADPAFAELLRQALSRPAP